MKHDSLNLFIDELEKEINEGGHTFLNIAQITIALKVLEDRLWDFDAHAAQRCDNLIHKLMKDV